MRSFQVYAPKARHDEYQKSSRLATGWLAAASTRTLQDRGFRLLGLAWAGARKESIRKEAAELAATQRPDVGWAQIPSFLSDAYVMGQALVALRQCGAVAANDAVYRKGVQFLVQTQLGDRSWYVNSRAAGIQPFFESGFPHGHDQWISAAASDWAAMALAAAEIRS